MFKAKNIDEFPQSQRYAYAAGLVIFLFIAILGLSLQRGKENKNYQKNYPTPVQQKGRNVEVVGIVRSAGLNQEEINQDNLQGIKYQVTDFPVNGNDQVTGYFLTGKETEAVGLGKCVQITGIVLDKWKEVKIKEAYSREPVEVASATEVGYENCSFFPVVSSYNSEFLKGSKTVTYGGTIERMTRPAPDIGYDYVLNLIKPILETNGAAGIPQKLESIVIVPGTNKSWLDLESNIHKKITVKGYWLWGFAESRYVEAVSVQSDTDK